MVISMHIYVHVCVMLYIHRFYLHTNAQTSIICKLKKIRIFISLLILLMNYINILFFVS